MLPSRRVLLLLALAAAPAGRALAQGSPVLRDPALPYDSWGSAARETAEAIAGRTLARPADGRYHVGDAVVFDDDGKRYRAHVIAVQPERDRYEVHYDGQPASWKTYATPREILGYQPGFVPPARAAAPGAAAAPRVAPVVAGTYGCSESIFRLNRGVEYEMRGSITLAAGGAYEYPGMRSRGRWRWDGASSAVRFTGGFLDGARATRLDGSPKLRVELPTADPERPRRWTCGPVDAR
ncbi:MAG: hypothetical protein ACXWZS_03880 [Gemmatirosa sp.]